MIKKTFKWLALSLLLLILLAMSFVAHEWYADKPWRFKSLLDREVAKIAFDSPETLTSLGFLEGIGITGHNAHLDDASVKKSDALFAQLPKIRSAVFRTRVFKALISAQRGT